MAKGDIVLIIFPFTDLSGNKLRPAVVLADTNLDLIVFHHDTNRLARTDKSVADACQYKWAEKAIPDQNE